MRTRVVWGGLGVAASLPVWGEHEAHTGAQRVYWTYRPLCGVRQNTEALGARTRVKWGVNVGGGRGQVHRDRPEGERPGLGPRPSLRPRRPRGPPRCWGRTWGAERSLLCRGSGRVRVTGAPAGNETASEVVPGHLTAPSFCSSLLPLKSSPFFFLEDTPLPLPGPPVPTDGAGDPAWRRAVGDGALLAGPAPSGGTW